MQRLSDAQNVLVPWAWGINGCASVAGATTATLLAVHLGFRAVVLLAILIYALSAWAFSRLTRALETTGAASD